MIFNASGGASLPALSNPGTASDLRNGKQLIGENGNVVTGILQDVTLATPSISVNASNGQISATVTQGSGGFVSADTKTATKTLSSADDPDFVAKNIAAGVNIFGLTGTAAVATDVEFTIHNDTDQSTTDFYYCSSDGTYKKDFAVSDGYTTIDNCMKGSFLFITSFKSKGGTVTFRVPSYDTDEIQEIVTQTAENNGETAYALYYVTGDGDIYVEYE